MKIKKTGRKKGDWSIGQFVTFAFAVLAFILLFIFIFSAEDRFKAAASWTWDTIMEGVRKAVGL